MSNVLLDPAALPGFKRCHPTPLRRTVVQDIDSGKEARVGKWLTQRWRYELEFELLRSSLSFAEWQRILTLFTRHAGQLDNFLFKVPDDNAVTDHGFGVGDGAKTKFPLQRTPLGQWQDVLGTWDAYTKPRTNLFLQSQQITVTWGKNAGTETFAANVAVAPDGTLTADSITSGAVTASGMFQSVTFPGGTVTSSIWMRVPSGTRAVNLTIGASISTVTVSSTWQRFSFAAAATGATDCVFYWSAAGAGEVLYVWGAQAETGSTPTRYIPTTTAAVREDPKYWTADQTTGALVAPGTPDGFEPATEPDWASVSIFADADGLGLRTLAPYSRTNLALQSRTLDNASWGKANVTITADASTAPDGTATADKIAETAISGQHYVSQVIAMALAFTYTYSAYVKAAERTKCELEIFTAADWGRGTFDLATGAVIAATNGGTGTGASASISAVGGGWYRITLSTKIGTAGSFACVVGVLDAAGTLSYLGTAGSGIYAWGAQVETGSVAGDYIPTTTAAVARTDYTMGSGGLVTFAAAPAAGAALSWTGSYFRRVRLNDDEPQLEWIMPGYYRGSLELLSVI